MRKVRLALMALPFLFASYVSNYYITNRVNTPLHKEQGEIQTTGLVVHTLDFLGFELGASYAVTSHTALILGGSFYNGDTQEEEVDFLPDGEPNLNYKPYDRTGIGEIGYGYFLPFGADSLFVFQAFGGYSIYMNNRAFLQGSSFSYLFNLSMGLQYRF